LSPSWSLSHRVDRIEIANICADVEVAARLHLDEDARVVRRSRRYLVNGRPVEQATSYIPADIAGRGR
jgi:GntR family transcriptional regulator